MIDLNNVAFVAHSRHLIRAITGSSVSNSISKMKNYKKKNNSHYLILSLFISCSC